MKHETIGKKSDESARSPGPWAVRATIVGRFFLLVLGYAVLQEIGLRLAFPPVGVAAFWPAAGWAMAVMARWSPRTWPLALAGLAAVNMAGNIAHGSSPIVAFGFAMVNAGEAAAGGYILRRAHRDVQDGNYLNTRWLSHGLIPAALIPTTVAAAIGGLIVWQVSDGVAWGAVWWTWISADSLGVLAIVPVVKAFVYTEWLRGWRWPRVAEAGALIAVEGAIIASVFATQHTAERTWQWPFNLLPGIFWAVIRFGPEFTACLTAVSTHAVIWGTAHGRGPFALAENVTDRMLSSQTFCVVVFLSSLTMAHVIAGRKVAEKQAREQSEAMTHAVEGISFIDPDGNYQRVNPAYADAVGMTPEELVGQNWAITVHPDDLPALEEAYRTMLESGKVTAQARGVRRDGTIFFKEVTMITEKGPTGRLLGHHCFMRDITDRRIAAQHIDQFFTLSQDLLCILGTDGYFRRINPAWPRTFGYTEREFLSRPFTDFLHPDDVEASQTEAQAIARGRTDAEFDNRYRTAGGEYRWLRWTSAPDPDGELLYGVARDITDIKNTEENLALARDQAIEASRLKSQFLATMSHEIRTPMNGIIGLGDLLARTTLTEKQQRYVDGIRGAADSLLGVINDILDFSKIEAGKIEISEVALDPARLITEVSSLMEQVAHRKGLTLRTDLDPLPPALLGDPGRIRQILLNLVGNAVKFTTTGTVTIHAGFLDHHPSPGAPPCLKLQVDDTGIGIATTELTSIFEPFRQADATETRTHGGTGLGLAITRQLVEAMAGTITVTSQPGTGTSFTVTIPAPVTDQPKTAEPEEIVGIHILVVDPDDTNRHHLTDQLSSWGIHSETAANTTQALKALRRGPEAPPFDLAIIDMQLPDSPIADFSEEMQSLPELQEIPIILLAGNGQPEAAIDDTSPTGVQAVLTKPAGNSTLYDAIMRIHSRSRAHTEDTATTSSLGHILLVEDNPTNQLVAADLLEYLGYTVDIAADGLEAIEKATHSDYQAILMDCQMPRMDGYTATERLRKIPTAAQLPIIAMTADAFQESRDKCLAVGMNDYLAKPIRTDELKRALNHWARQEAVDLRT
ncbi:response regulator [Actinoplanes xinjiangensis]|uniref:response regulator n=1 Tax=Actinoplanes xinjiangensis TaxID=512350 RepID=UPI003413A0A6